MKSSLELYNMYPEINDGIPVNNTMRAKAEALRLDLAAQPVPPVVMYQSPNPGNSIWDHLPNSITTTSILNPATLTAQSYKSVVKNSITQASSPKEIQTGNQQQHHHQRQERDSD